MTPNDQQALWAVCERSWTRLHRRWSGVNLPAADWDDIQIVAFTKVFHKVVRFNPLKAGINTWATTVIRRSVLNSLRDLLVINPGKSREYKWRRRLLRPRRIHTRTVEIGRWGEETVVIEPDIADVPPARNAHEIAEFYSLLEADDRKVLEAGLAGLPIRRLKSVLKVKETRAYQIPKQLNAKWRHYLAGEVPA